MIRASNYALLAVAVLCALPAAVGQLLYNADPSINWSARGEPVRQGNGVFLSPGEDSVISTSDTGTITAWDSFDGTELWSYTPSAGDGTVLSCSSGVTFIETDTMEYMIYSVIVNETLYNPLR
jgi:outer membrane protein assembly factor BamB